MPPRPLVLVLATWLPSVAAAADVDLFEPAGSLPGGAGTLQGEAPTLGPAGLTAGLLAGFAKDPVVRRFSDGTVEPAVSGLVPVTLHGGWTLEDRLRLEAFLPVYWVDAGPVTGFSGAAAGDLRLQAAVPVWDSGDERLAVAVVPRLGLPTGTADALVAGGLSGSLVGSVGGRIDRFGWVGNAGLRLAGADTLGVGSTALGSAFELLGGGFFQATDALRVGAELDLDLGLATAGDGATENAIAHLFVQDVLPSGLGLTAGVGTGLLAGIGTPEYRVMAALTWAAVKRDGDGDGLVDDADACPAEPEDADGFEDTDGCPDIDNDRDGLLDVADLCPLEPEDLDDFSDDDGCPDRDNDRDGLADADDACPLEPGTAEHRGCPDLDGDDLVDTDQCPREAGPASAGGCPDRDGDRVPDLRDACPDEPAPPEEDPATSDGCPRTVYVVGGEIRITERVEFELGKATLTRESLPILDQVVDVLRRNPAIQKVEVQGHTDNVGSPTVNLRLSQQRADAVVDHLVGQGVARGRLVAKGYGETQPMFTNRTPKGRDGNRRVQFVILETAPAAGAGATRPAPAPVPAPVVPAPVVPVPVIPVVPAPAPEPPPAGPPGSLSIKVQGGEWATIWVDGQKLTRAAPFLDHPLPAGTHRVRAENPRLRLVWEETVTVEPGGRLTLIVPTGGGPAPGAEAAPAAPAEASPWGELLAPDDEDDSPWGETTGPAPAPAPAPEPTDEGRPPRKSKKR